MQMREEFLHHPNYDAFWQRLAFAASATAVAVVVAIGFVSLFHLTFTGLLA